MNRDPFRLRNAQRFDGYCLGVLRIPRLGVLVPSSNNALEPLVAAILSSVLEVTAHFSRFPVTRIDLSVSGMDQFTAEPILAAAQLLADAQVDVICWNGTSSGWLGFDADRALCAAPKGNTGIPAVTSVWPRASVRPRLVSPTPATCRTGLSRTIAHSASLPWPSSTSDFRETSILP